MYARPEWSEEGKRRGNKTREGEGRRGRRSPAVPLRDPTVRQRGRGDRGPGIGCQLLPAPVLFVRRHSPRHKQTYASRTMTRLCCGRRRSRFSDGFWLGFRGRARAWPGGCAVDITLLAGASAGADKGRFRGPVESVLICTCTDVASTVGQLATFCVSCVVVRRPPPPDLTSLWSV